MANDLFLNELSKGPEHWNQWIRGWIRSQRLGNAVSLCEPVWKFEAEQRRSIDLTKADLQYTNLVGADLSYVDLKGSDLRWAHLERANLSCTHLEGAQLYGACLEDAAMWSVHLEEADLMEAHLDRGELEEAHLEGACLMKAHLQGANLAEAHLEGADLKEVYLEGADLMGAYLNGADLRVAHLNGADLRAAYLDGADLMKAHLEGVNLGGASLDNASLVYAVGVEFDSNRINGTSFTAHPDRPNLRGLSNKARKILKYLAFMVSLEMGRYDDRWSFLRRNYTGTKLVLIWLALVAFVIPRIVTGLWFYALSGGNFLLQGVAELDPEVSAGISSAWKEWMTQHERSRVIWVFLGLTEFSLVSVLWAMLTMSLMVYTIARFWLTLQVLPLRDAEARSNRTPAKEDYIGLYIWHQRIAWILLLSWILTIWNLFLLGKWMWTTTVLVF